MVSLASNPLFRDNSFPIGALMSIDRMLQQTDPTVLANKLIGQDFLTLALFVIVVLSAVLGLFVYMSYRKQVADDKRQDILITLFTDEKSPLVKSVAHSATAIEISNTQTQFMTQALNNLGVKTDAQTATVSAAIEAQTKSQTDNQIAIANNLNNHNERLDEVTANVKQVFERLDKLEANVNALPEKWSADLVASRAIAIEAIKGIIGDLRTEIMVMLGKSMNNGEAKRPTLSVAAVVNTEKP